jgi:hypothetical protein
MKLLPAEKLQFAEPQMARLRAALDAFDCVGTTARGRRRLATKAMARDALVEMAEIIALMALSMSLRKGDFVSKVMDEIDGALAPHQRCKA